MKRYLVLAFVLVLALILPTFAEMESQKCGPYLVTFNLTTIEKMNFSKLNPVYYGNNILYGLRLSNRTGNDCGLIGICTFYQPAPSYISLDNLASFVESSYKNMTYSHITRTQRTIDGHLGFVVTGVDLSGHLDWIAGYWIVNGSTEVEVQGNHDWKMNDVSAILESIHIKRAGF
jgi:hypothetical protein